MRIGRTIYGSNAIEKQETAILQHWLINRLILKAYMAEYVAAAAAQ